MGDFIIIGIVILLFFSSGAMMFAAGKKSRLYLWEYTSLILPFFIWYLYKGMSQKSTSLSNAAVEIQIIFVSIILYSFIRNKFAQKFQLKHKVFGCVIFYILPIILRLVMPNLSE
jgi:hypothetical protein